jgi:long-chain acyl-CoA synthetase
LPGTSLIKQLVNMRLIRMLAGPGVVRPTGLIVRAMLGRRAERDPDRVALVDGRDSLTSGRWDAATKACAHGLRKCPVESGDHVVLASERAAWVQVAIEYCGTLKAGAVAAPLSGSCAAAQLRDVVRHARAGFPSRDAGANDGASVG